MKSFGSSISGNISEIWLEYNKIPLKWQFPIGVIVDSLKIDLQKGPIPIYVHSRLIPLDKVLSYQSLDSLRFYFINSLKEANKIKFSKENVVLNLSVNDTQALRKIAYSNDVNLIREYRNIMNTLSGNGFNPVEKYPVKLIFDSMEFILTKPFCLDNSNSMEATMKDYFNAVLTKDVYEKIKEKYEIIIHGIEVEESMTFLYYYNHFSAMDNFLYIIFVEKSEKSD